MPLLFSYGALQHEEVQLATFGRALKGEPDLLIGYEPALVKIADRKSTRLNSSHVSESRMPSSA